MKAKVCCLMSVHNRISNTSPPSTVQQLFMGESRNSLEDEFPVQAEQPPITHETRLQGPDFLGDKNSSLGIISSMTEESQVAPQVSNAQVSDQGKKFMDSSITLFSDFLLHDFRTHCLAYSHCRLSGNDGCSVPWAGSYK